MSEMNQGAAPPSGSWTHSFEEDEPGGVLIYRPTHSFAFPPTRAGRDTIVFGEAGQLSQLAPGPDDRPRASPGSWTALGMNRFALGGTAGAPGQVIEVIEANQGVLKIRKL
jgi:hypothetical protein